MRGERWVCGGGGLCECDGLCIEADGVYFCLRSLHAREHRSLKETLKYDDIFETIPIVLRNSALQSALLYELEGAESLASVRPSSTETVRGTLFVIMSAARAVAMTDHHDGCLFLSLCLCVNRTLHG